MRDMARLAWAAIVEWCGHSCQGRGADRKSSRLPGDPDDTHSRYIEAAIGGIVVGGLAAPNHSRGRLQCRPTDFDIYNLGLLPKSLGAQWAGRKKRAS
jgi:hypothetical protein